MLKWIGGGLAAFVLVGIVVVYGMGAGWFGTPPQAGRIQGAALSAETVADRAVRQTRAARTVGISDPKQILFGDLHVHTTFSADAFFLALPLIGGEGVRPPADACDYARYCSALDFWSINDHVEAYSPAQWKEAKTAIRQCNASAGDPDNPDLVSYLGWEWTQVGTTRDTHYGHKNVIFRDDAEDAVPVRPIAAGGGAAGALAGPDLGTRIRMTLFAPGGSRDTYLDYARYTVENSGLPVCEKGVDVRDLPPDCIEFADTPAELFDKLGQWGYPSLVIPHGTTWGFYTPAGTSLDKQLAGDMHDPKYQRLIEVFSGHGNSEEYRDWRAAFFDDDGNATCPEPTGNYTASCWRAGEIIEERCLAAGESAGECAARASEARANYLDAGTAGFRTVPGATVDDWGDAGQCTDCFLPAFNHRPGNSVQYALAISNFDDPDVPRRFRFGFMASSDNHYARPGTGYKEFGRADGNIEGGGPQQPGGDLDPELARGEPLPKSMPFDPATSEFSGFQLLETERQASFFMTGGLIAAHSQGRDRGAIWDAMERREVYGTSGDRILLWFDLVNAPGDEQVPMGGEARMAEAPRFVVRAAGAFEQKPGCPDHATDALSPERLDRLCGGECYNPSDARKQITHIEVVRVLPQKEKGEPIAPLIQDPWRTYTCAPDRDTCLVTFDDPEYATLGRDATYYVRAIQEPTPAVNGGQLRCEYDENGKCVKVNACWKDYRTPRDDDCLADVAERAWSSPIYLTHGG